MYFACQKMTGFFTADGSDGSSVRFGSFPRLSAGIALAVSVSLCPPRVFCP